MRSALRREPRGRATVKALGLLGAVLLAGLVWRVSYPARSDLERIDHTLAQPGKARATMAPAATSASAADTSASTGLMSPPDSVGQATQGRAPTATEIAALGLTRQLAGEHLLTMDGRRQRVLGSKATVDQANHSDTMLVIRDEVSGQLSYRRSGLQFTLKPGADYGAFIAEHRSMQPVFVNSLYAQVLVDAAEIAAHYNALRQDDRVASLRFMTREPVVKPK